MRTALLSATKHDETGKLRALAPLVGRSVLGWQVDFARAMGCERIICLSERQDPELLALQQEFEAREGEFHLIRSSLQLVSLLKTDDQLLMILDGLITADLAPSHFETSGSRLVPSVWAIAPASQPAQSSPDDFERIDAAHNWAGVAVVNAATVQKLADCPSDGDPVSLLVRLALQDGVRLAERAGTAVGRFEPAIAKSSNALTSLENSVLEERLGTPASGGPFLALASKLAVSSITGKVALSAGMLFAGSAVSTLAAGLLSWFGQPSLALLSLAIAIFCNQAVLAFQRARHDPRSHSRVEGYPSVLRLFLAAICIVILVLALDPTSAPIALLSLPILAVGLAELASQTDNIQVSAFWSDRALHLVGFAIAAFAGVLAPALALFGIGAVAYKLLIARENAAN